MYVRRGVVSVALALGLTFVGPTASLVAGPQTVTGENYAIATGHPEATAAGLAVLRDGGNVIDAAVAASLTLGVAEPYGSGLGGKLVLLYHDSASGDVWCIEALCPSAAATDPEEFASLESNSRNFGYRSVCVPGYPAGLYAAHQKWGSKPWRGLASPAVKLARKGAEITEEMRELWAPHRRELAADAEASRLFLQDGKTPSVGARLPNPDLAESLERLAEHGADGFYQGTTAERILAAARAAGSPLMAEDFANYEPRFSEPLAINYRGYRVYSSPPPLTGGVTVLTGLLAQAPLDWPVGKPRDAEYIDWLGRILQVFYPQINVDIADTPDAADKAREMLSAESIQAAIERARELDPVDPEAEPVAQIFHKTFDDRADASTTHLVVADAEGNMVSLTQSLSLHFGAAVVAPGTGVLLNDSMSNFATNWRESPNYTAGGKRPRSTVAPVLATRDGVPALAVGFPGGQRIPTMTLQVLVDTLGSNVPLDESIRRGRFHLRRPTTSKQPKNLVDMEEGDDPAELESVRAKLADLGWDTVAKRRDGRYFGGGNGIQYLPGKKLAAVADPRRTNEAAAE